MMTNMLRDDWFCRRLFNKAFLLEKILHPNGKFLAAVRISLQYFPGCVYHEMYSNTKLK